MTSGGLAALGEAGCRPGAAPHSAARALRAGRPAQAGLRWLSEPGASAARQVLELRPIPPSWSFLATSALLAGLFGAPALAVLLDPARHDPWSLGAAACGLLICGLAGLAMRRALAGRRRQRIILDSTGVEGRSGRHGWDSIAGLAVLPPDGNRFAPAPLPGDPLAGSHRLGASIAAAQRAADWRLALHLHHRGRPVILARGLDQATAEALHAALLAAWPGRQGG